MAKTVSYMGNVIGQGRAVGALVLALSRPPEFPDLRGET